MVVALERDPVSASVGDLEPAADLMAACTATGGIAAPGSALPSLPPSSRSGWRCLVRRSTGGGAAGRVLAVRQGTWPLYPAVQFDSFEVRIQATDPCCWAGREAGESGPGSPGFQRNTHEPTRFPSVDSLLAAAAR